ncbi:MAG: hypothetical protein F7B20_02130 [Aeropyrum sp.]|nr:hypothetical protein [Aeropyrum sp.]MCE4616155.1 hypothetical protein [Aeropyrum sp.]
MSLVVERIGDLIEAAPKSGAKAAIYLGVLSSIMRLADDSQAITRFAECLALAGQGCKESGGSTLCQTGCASVFLVKASDGSIVAKYSDTAGSLKVGGGEVEIKTEEARLKILPRTLIVGLRSGDGWREIEIDSASVDDVVNNAYFVKYAVRKVGRLVRTLQWDLRGCARARAVTC